MEKKDSFEGKPGFVHVAYEDPNHECSAQPSHMGVSFSLIEELLVLLVLVVLLVVVAVLLAVVA